MHLVVIRSGSRTRRLIVRCTDASPPCIHWHSVNLVLIVLASFNYWELICQLSLLIKAYFIWCYKSEQEFPVTPMAYWHIISIIMEEIPTNVNKCRKFIFIYFFAIWEHIKTKMQKFPARFNLRGCCTPDHFCDCLCIFSKITIHLWQIRYVSYR